MMLEVILELNLKSVNRMLSPGVFLLPCSVRKPTDLLSAALRVPLTDQDDTRLIC